ncbi:MAG TPA: hypothetical protein VGE64_06170 [Xanthomonadaceae bacterium]
MFAGIAQLRVLRMRQMVMLSGDNQQVADVVAKSVGTVGRWIS